MTNNELHEFARLLVSEEERLGHRVVPMTFVLSRKLHALAAGYLRLEEALKAPSLSNPLKDVIQ